MRNGRRNYQNNVLIRHTLKIMITSDLTSKQLLQMANGVKSTGKGLIPLQGAGGFSKQPTSNSLLAAPILLITSTIALLLLLRAKYCSRASHAHLASLARNIFSLSRLLFLSKYQEQLEAANACDLRADNISNCLDNAGIYAGNSKHL
jgi:hypothetical protein